MRQTEYDFTAKLRAYADLGYESPAIDRKMMSMKLWVCRGCGAGASDIPTIGFDYCSGRPARRDRRRTSPA